MIYLWDRWHVSDISRRPLPSVAITKINIEPKKMKDVELDNPKLAVKSWSVWIYRGYPAKRAVSAMRKHGG